MAAREAKSEKWLRECAAARANNNIPDGLTEEFVKASYLVWQATDFAISKAFRSNQDYFYLLRKEEEPETGRKFKIRLSKYDIEKMAKRALPYVPDFIASRSEYLEDPELALLRSLKIMPSSLPFPSQYESSLGAAYHDAMELFESHSDEEMLEKIKCRIPKLLGTICEIVPNPEP